ncbi:hypothetical protein [Chryseobacterium phocaeense]|uniref:hypothetical protein n=1 Tax=Chryseobacterium phocaeense TaxID=1816690 RepID=UPI00111BA3A9|nr:hypothetical protein [Chryseobacterium phocaeense]
MKNQIYIPIKSSTLAFYFSKGIILPSVYYKNKPTDIQDKAGNFILLSKNKWVENCDCSVEIILTEEELNLNIIDDNFSKLNKPLPISRIKRIYFFDKKQMDVSVWNVNNGNGFIPPHLTTLENPLRTDFIPYNNEGDFEKNENLEFEKKVNTFDKVLGAMAFMKIGAPIDYEFPLNYFSTLSHFNKLIGEQLKSEENRLGLKFSERYKGIFKNEDNEWLGLQKHLYTDIDINLIKDIAKKNGMNIEIKLGQINLNMIDKNSLTFDLAILYTYGEGRSKSTEDLIGFLRDGNISAEKKEELSLLYGLYSGYSKLRNKYKTNGSFTKVKFELEDKLDYYIIESIYQFYFNNSKENYSFTYLDNLFVSQKTKNIKSDYYIILDKLIKNPPKKNFSKEFWNIYSGDICKILADYTKNTIPPFLLESFDSEKSVLFFKNMLENVMNQSISSFLSQYNNIPTEDTNNRFLVANTKEPKSFKNDLNIKEIERHDTIKNEIDKSGKIIDNDSYVKTVNYEKFSLAELKAVGKFLGIPNISKYKKDNITELVSLIKNNKIIL